MSKETAQSTILSTDAWSLAMSPFEELLKALGLKKGYKISLPANFNVRTGRET